MTRRPQLWKWALPEGPTSPVPTKVLPFPMQVQATCTHTLEIMALWKLSNKNGQLML